ncbi:ABC transporter substrate-binding protein [Arcanobacterium ihumii]|uniref:ABC transporter substrate-binding protein n=1 Tax=Arcanobacterium ihumii TaxID=2138162 RepID=UPI000F54049E|nr:ABC transporter substrate-binding protein [Arcanobacterium ihumii]
MRRKPFAAVCLSIALALSACGAEESKSGSGESRGSEITSADLSKVEKVDSIAAMVPEAVKSDGTLTVGNNIYYAPAEFYGSDGKTAQGYDIDLTNALAKVMGLKADIQQAEFAAIIPAIGSKYELGVANFSINQERIATVNMIEYLRVGSSWSVQKGNPKKFDPKNPCGAIVGVQTGTIQDEEIDALNAKCPADKKIQIQRYNEQSAVTTALAGGKLVAMSSDSSVAEYASTITNGSTELVGDPENVAGVGIVVSKQDDQLTKATQAALKYLIDNGQLNEIFKTWGITDGISKDAALNPAN